MSGLFHCTTKIYFVSIQSCTFGKQCERDSNGMAGIFQLLIHCPNASHTPGKERPNSVAKSLILVSLKWHDPKYLRYSPACKLILQLLKKKKSSDCQHHEILHRKYGLMKFVKRTQSSYTILFFFFHLALILKLFHVINNYKFWLLFSFL